MVGMATDLSTAGFWIAFNAAANTTTVHAMPIITSKATSDFESLLLGEADEPSVVIDVNEKYQYSKYESVDTIPTKECASYLEAAH